MNVRGAGVLGTGAKPSPRANHSACYITGTGKPMLLITGGITTSGTVLDEFWIMDLEDRIWRQVHAVTLIVQLVLGCMSLCYSVHGEIWGRGASLSPF